MEDPVSDSTSGPGFGFRFLLFPGAIGLFSLACLLAGYGDYGITWDEAYPNFPAARQQAAWFQRFLATGEGFDREGIRSGFETESDHPSLPRTWMALSRLILPASVGDRIAFGLPTLVAVSFFMGLLAEVLRRRFGWLAAITGAGCLLFHPRFFAHSHFAAYDVPIVLAWWMSAQAFYRANATDLDRASSWKRNLAASFLFGLALSIKLHAFFLPFPLFAWMLIFQRWTGFRCAVCSAVVAPLVYLATQPYLWWETLDRLSQRFLDYSEKVPITVYYWGHSYPGNLPWHYPWVMLAVTLPAGLTLLALLGVFAFPRKVAADKPTPSPVDRSWWVFVLLNLATTPALFSWQSPYDGIRLFLAALPFVALFAAAGAWVLEGWLSKNSGQRGRLLARAVCLLLVGSQGTACYRFHPNGLAYYSLLAGGVRGAQSLGFETTFWCDGFTRPMIEEWAHKSPADTTVRIHALDAVLIQEYQRLGWVPETWKSVRSGPATVRAIQFRQGFFGPEEWMLVDSGRRVLVENSLEGVPLARVYAGP